MSGAANSGNVIHVQLSGLSSLSMDMCPLLRYLRGCCHQKCYHIHIAYLEATTGD